MVKTSAKGGKQSILLLVSGVAATGHNFAADACLHLTFSTITKEKELMEVTMSGLCKE